MPDYPMFSGGEKKSFYELSVVIGTNIFSLNIKSADKAHARD